MRDWERLKEEFGEALKAKLATMEAASAGNLASVVEHAKEEFGQLKRDLATLYGGANQKFKDIEEWMDKHSKNGYSDGDRQGYVPKKMAFPKHYSH